MAVEHLASQSITNLDATPIVPNSAGQGAAGRIVSVDDWVAATASGLGSVGSTYRLCRFPTGAIIKSVVLATDQALDTNATNTLAFDLNVAFSDAPADGTPANLQALIPTSANTGATTSIASYASPNKIFGTVTPASHTAAYGPTDVAFNGIGATYNFLGITQQPLWQTFGFVDGRGNPADPGGYFDLLLYVSTAAATAHLGNIYARVTAAI